MQTQATEPSGNGICVAHGYGLKIFVHRGHLIVHDGVGRQRQTRRYHRATSKLRRLVVLGHTGYITLEALRWLYDIGAALIHLSGDGKLITTSTATGPGHAALRRAQAIASGSQTGVEIARDLLYKKVAGQASLLSDLSADTNSRAILYGAPNKMAAAADLTALVAAEAEAASAYWKAWSNVTVQIGSRDQDEIPDHWRSFGQRHSPLSSSPRLACNPANAILNYLYALLEAETTLACHTVGLDPMLGIFHTDQRSRSSIALDAMEAVRPVVDAYVLAMITQRTLARDDFTETRQGTCRITPQFACRLAETIHNWRHHVGPVVEGVAHTLARSAVSPVSLASPLTHAQHHAAWQDRAPAKNQRRSKASLPILPNSCRDCGTDLPDRRKRYCESCRSQRWATNAGHGRDNAAKVLARLRAEQQDPAHGGRAAQIRGRKNAAHQRAVRDWIGDRIEPQVFVREILLGLRDVPVAQLAAATGLSEHYCSMIRLGKKVPHPRHWPTLRELGTQVAGDTDGDVASNGLSNTSRMDASSLPASCG